MNRPEVARDSAQRKLAKTLALLGSPHEGERATAAAFADRQLRELGLTWRALVARGLAEPAIALPQPARRAAINPTSQIHWLRSCGPFLGSWERGFVESLHRQTRPLSERQREKLAEVVRRVETRCGGAAEAGP